MWRPSRRLSAGRLAGLRVAAHPGPPCRALACVCACCTPCNYLLPIIWSRLEAPPTDRGWLARPARQPFFFFLSVGTGGAVCGGTHVVRAPHSLRSIDPVFSSQRGAA